MGKKRKTYVKVRTESFLARTKRLETELAAEREKTALMMLPTKAMLEVDAKIDSSLEALKLPAPVANLAKGMLFQLFTLAKDDKNVRTGENGSYLTRAELRALAAKATIEGAGGIAKLFAPSSVPAKPSICIHHGMCFPCVLCAGHDKKASDPGVSPVSEPWELVAGDPPSIRDVPQHADMPKTAPPAAVEGPHTSFCGPSGTGHTPQGSSLPCVPCKRRGCAVCKACPKCRKQPRRRLALNPQTKRARAEAKRSR